jgi:hypothetical protein
MKAGSDEPVFLMKKAKEQFFIFSKYYATIIRNTTC